MIENKPPSEAPKVDPGRAGASARAEHERRRTRRSARVRAAHPVLGGVLLALSSDPQTTVAWAVGAEGEERLGARLDSLQCASARVLHDRRIPGTRANIDHLVVCPRGVVVIDAKKYHGRPERRVEGGLFRSRVETLFVGRRNRTNLVEGLLRQVGLVRSAVADAGDDPVEMFGMLCFVDADWPLIGGSFSVRGVQVLWPRRAMREIQQPGDLGADAIDAIHRRLAAAFPMA